MAVKLNLLPQNLAVSGNLAKIVSFIRAINVIFLSMFLLAGIGAVFYYLFFSVDLRKSTQNVASLTAQLKAEQSVEQSLVLIRDRVAKIKPLLSSDTTSKSLNNLENFTSQISESSTIGDLSLDSQKIDTSLSIPSSSELTKFFASLYSSPIFKTITLQSFEVNPKTGYLIALRLFNK